MWRTVSRFEEASTDVPGRHAHHCLRACMPRMGLISLATGVRCGANHTRKSERFQGRLNDRDIMVQHGGHFHVLRRHPPPCRAHVRTITSARACGTWESSFSPRACATARTPRPQVDVFPQDRACNGIVPGPSHQPVARNGCSGTFPPPCTNRGRQAKSPARGA